MTDEHRLKLEESGRKGGEALIAKLGDKSKEHFSRLGKLSAERRKRKKQEANE